MKNKKQNLRAKKTIHKMVANGGKSSSLAQSMRESGYSESYARNPQKIKQTKVWKEYLQEFIPDESIATAHKTLVEASRISKMDFPISLSDKEIKEIVSSNGRSIFSIVRNRSVVKVVFSEPDFSTRIRAVDLAYKVKGLYCDRNTEGIQNELAHLSDSELKDMIAKYKGFFAKTNPLPSF